MLSASSAYMWLKCTRSALLNKSVSDEESSYAKEGTDAHALCEYKLNLLIGNKTTNPIDTLTTYSKEMEECSDMYANYVSEKLEEIKKQTKDPLVLVEERLDFSNFVPDGFGTGDLIIVADNTLTIVDFKYGMGVLVEAKDNPQMMLYALGAIDKYDGIYDIENIEMVIFQPRRENISSHTISKVELLEWANGELRTKAKLANKGEGEFIAGEHCRFCKVRGNCRKRAEENLKIAKYDFKMPSLLEAHEIESILGLADELVSWVSDIKDYALSLAMSGEEFKDFKLVEGRSTRKIKDIEEVVKVLKDEGIEPFDYKLKGITTLTKELGKEKFEILLGGYIVKPSGKPTLVKRSDKRKEISIIENEFKESEEN